MRGNDFLNKMENVDLAYIEAAELSSKKKTNSRSKWGALVACLCLCLVVLGAVTMFPKHYDTMTGDPIITGDPIKPGNSDLAENNSIPGATHTENANDTTVTSALKDYPAAIMVEGQIYLFSPEPMVGEVDDSAIIGHTISYTDSIPERDGETNFNRELEMPYARVDGGIAVWYEDEWHLCSPQNK